MTAEECDATGDAMKITAGSAICYYNYYAVHAFALK